LDLDKSSCDGSSRAYSREHSVTATRKGVLHSSSEFDRLVRCSTQIMHVTGVISHNTPRKSPLGNVSHTHTHTSHDDLTFITSKAETGDPYLALLELDDEFGDDLIKMMFYPRLKVKVIGTPNLKSKITSKCDRTTSSHKLF